MSPAPGTHVCLIHVTMLATSRLVLRKGLRGKDAVEGANQCASLGCSKCESNDGCVNALLVFIAPSVRSTVRCGGACLEELGGNALLSALCLKVRVDVQVSKMNKDAQMRAAINQKLIETGERER